MEKVEVILNNKTGLHARPASVITKVASRFKSDIKITKDGREGNAKSIVSILSIAAVYGDSLFISAEGIDDMEAITTIKQLIENNFVE
ncbi:HPr family phosphocarrier protein [Alkaliphilus peptidifermentans]|uniref:Phosphocarrier protein HPr n=1 Tax=Alkaliphilus peptidifermentans DSM 18978 TaxID=1120976 RepID=A0A1G5BJX8_9FIRM|nr:HPr family phosphocarrier protein [Alkaliphilus peptidifermentans]SCX90471.1 phosphocarrier protein [Alkaliphilus peptidifermentans DSM 18978]